MNKGRQLKSLGCKNLDQTQNLRQAGTRVTTAALEGEIWVARCYATQLTAVCRGMLQRIGVQITARGGLTDLSVPCLGYQWSRGDGNKGRSRKADRELGVAIETRV